MGRHHYAKDYKVTVGAQGQRKTYYEQHDNRESGQPSRGGGSHNRVWRKGDKRVSFRGEKRGGISKRGGVLSRPKFDTSAVARVLNDGDDEMHRSSHQSGRARPASRAMRGKYRGGSRGIPIDRSRFVKLAPLSEDNKNVIKEAMNKRYGLANKALDLNNFGNDSAFGGSSGATGRLTDERVVECVLETIGEHLRDLEAVNLSNNGLRTLRVLGKIADKAPNIKILYLHQNKLAHSRELDNVSKLSLVELKLDENPFMSNFKDGSHYSSVIQKKFKTLQLLDGKQLEKLITFEEDEATSSGPKSVDIPANVKMVVNDQVGDFIGKFLEQYITVYDSDNREQLAMAYHEDAIMSLQANFPKFAMDASAKDYLHESRNLQIDHIRENPNKRDRLLHQKRLQIIGFLDKLPKTQHDITTLTLDVPFATDRLVTFTVTGAFRERNENPPQPIRHFSRTFTVVPQGEGLCIINDNYFVTTATREQTERSNALFVLAKETGMNPNWTKMCLEGKGWNLEEAKSAFLVAKQEGKIPPEAFT